MSNRLGLRRLGALAWGAVLWGIASLGACSPRPVPPSLENTSKSERPEFRAPESWQSRSAWQQFQAGRQAAGNEDWGEAVYYYDLALSEFLVERSDSAFSMDSLYFYRMPTLIVEALEEAFPGLASTGHSDGGMAFAYDYLEDWQESEDNFVTADSAEIGEIRSFLDTLELKRFGLPVELNERVLQELHFLTHRVRSFTESSLGRMSAYEEMVRAKLRANGMPEDLRFLAMVESGYKPKAFSRAKAGGIWQFIPGTATRYGLKIDFWVDMRRDPEAATDAAIRYLSSLYKEFGDWNLAMAAYNCGEGRIRRQLRENGPISYWEMNLPRETMHYVPRILAATIIGHFPHKYGFTPEPQARLPFDTVSVAEFLPLDMAADALGISVQTLRDLNLELIGYSTPPRRDGYVLKIPPSTRERFSVAYAKMDRSKFARHQQHRVRSGENLGLIARRYGVSVAQIQAANGMRGTLLRVGQVLIVPGPGGSASASRSQAVGKSATTPRTSAAPSGGSLTYTVRSGDNLFSIARKYGVSVADLQSWNRLTGSSLQVGQNLRVRMPTVPIGNVGVSNEASRPAPSSKTGSLAGSSEYVVRSGDNPYSISRRLGVNLSDLLSWNGLNQESRLQIGQRLIVRTAAAVPSKASGSAGVSKGVYTVRSGDSLWDIARRHGLTLQQLQEWNALPDTRIQPGQNLRLSSE